MEKLALLLAVLVAAPACAPWKRAPETPGADGAPKYPRRPPGCKLAVFESPTPAGIAAWDDLGVAEVACHINIASAECIGRLRAEACRMGGNILYNVPSRPLRPRDEVIVYRAQVAHTRAAAKGTTATPDKPDQPPTAEPEATSSSPIEPLPHAPVDAGAD